MAASCGFEPQLLVPETNVLPLDDKAKFLIAGTGSSFTSPVPVLLVINSSVDFHTSTAQVLLCAWPCFFEGANLSGCYEGHA